MACCLPVSLNKDGSTSLVQFLPQHIDPEIHEIIEHEKKRQWESLALIPSEVGEDAVRCPSGCPAQQSIA